MQNFAFELPVKNDNLPLASIAIMLSDKRDIVPQYDLNTARLCALRHQLNKEGKRIGNHL